ncbi:hypothetical protein J1605_013618 [Eschrichtius robustus]|uniref:Uncharacterized protein n=1 Tax=Eschrichtius robustus TaxID=9764 RepID=A0AB34GI00_ESCRO|nr:hypothetical protein J1605_013618 [Eschrichtius robustus]
MPPGLAAGAGPPASVRSDSGHRRRWVREDRGGPAGAMRSLPSLRGPRAPPLPLLLLCLLAPVRRSSEDGRTPAAPFTSLPVREEMMAKYSNLSLESHNISLTGKCIVFQII